MLQNVDDDNAVDTQIWQVQLQLQSIMSKPKKTYLNSRDWRKNRSS